MYRLNLTREQQKENLKQMAELAEKTNGSKCNKCDGSGVDSWSMKMLQFTPCICIVKAVKKIEKEKGISMPKTILLGQDN